MQIMSKQISHAIHLLIFMLLVVLLGTCASSIYFADGESDINGAAAFVPTPLLNVAYPEPVIPGPALAVFPTVEVAPITENEWSLVRPGLERRVIQIYDGQNQLVETLHLWRLDQKYFRMDLAFDDSPKSLEAWQKETSALMVVNGGFYSIDNERYYPDGLFIFNGSDYGNSLNRFEGLLAIKESGTEIRWLKQAPYDPAELLWGALQSFPILVEPGGGLAYGPEREGNASARRTVVALDKQGRILFMIAPHGHFTLPQLSVYLTESDLDLEVALNLDGGGSTGVLVASPFEVIPTTRPIPFVILVYAR